MGPAEPTPPRAPGPLAFSDTDYVRDILTGAGWSDVRIDERQPPLLGMATAEEQAAFSIEMGPVSRLIAERQPDAATVASLRTELTKELATYATETGVEDTQPALLRDRPPGVGGPLTSTVGFRTVYYHTELRKPVRPFRWDATFLSLG